MKLNVTGCNECKDELKTGCNECNAEAKAGCNEYK